jgi:DNA-binding MarR family transcriptional regulator
MHKAIKTLVVFAGDMNMLELAILLEIAKTPQCRMIDISEHFSITMQSAHFHVHRLALGSRDRAGLDLVTVRRSDVDRRSRKLDLTSRGRMVADAMLNLTGEKAAVGKRCDKTKDWVQEKPRYNPNAKSIFDN